jgi:hypothetical protein
MCIPSKKSCPLVRILSGVSYDQNGRSASFQYQCPPSLGSYSPCTRACSKDAASSEGASSCHENAPHLPRSAPVMGSSMSSVLQRVASGHDSLSDAVFTWCGLEPFHIQPDSSTILSSIERRYVELAAPSFIYDLTKLCFPGSGNCGALAGRTRIGRCFGRILAPPSTMRIHPWCVVYGMALHQ